MGVFARGKKSQKKFNKKAKLNVDKTQNKRIKRLEYNLPEMKYYTTYDGANNVATARTNAIVLNNLTSAISQGVTGTNRIADQILVHRIEVKGVIYGSTYESPMIRMILYQDNRIIAGGSDLTGAQLIMNYGEVDTEYDSMLSPLNPDYVTTKAMGKQNVRILADKLIVLPQGSVTAETVSSKVFGYSKTFKKPLKVNYVNTNASYGQILIAFVPGVDTTAGSNPKYAHQQTVYYTDG